MIIILIVHFMNIKTYVLVIWIERDQSAYSIIIPLVCKYKYVIILELCLSNVMCALRK